MKFLVFGVTGMAGHTISLYLQECGYKVVGFSRRSVSFLEEQVNGDVHDIDLVSKTIVKGEFDVVINCVGILNQYAERNRGEANYLNAVFPHVLAGISRKSHTRVFQLSTDCVFKGNTGPYTESSIPDGETIYDRTKADGELHDDQNITFRCSIVGPDINSEGIGLLNWFMKQEGTIKGFTNAIWTGLTTLELAKAIECAAHENVTGLVNMVPESNISKYELLGLFNKHLRRNALNIIPDSVLHLDKTLIRTNYESSFRPKSYSGQIIELASWIRGHRKLYAHYVSL